MRKLEEVSCQCRGIGASVEAVHGKVEAHEKTLRDVSNTCQQMLGMLQALGLAERTQVRRTFRETRGTCCKNARKFTIRTTCTSVAITV